MSRFRTREVRSGILADGRERDRAGGGRSRHADKAICTYKLAVQLEQVLFWAEGGSLQLALGSCPAPHTVFVQFVAVAAPMLPDAAHSTTNGRRFFDSSTGSGTQRAPAPALSCCHSIVRFAVIFPWKDGASQMQQPNPKPGQRLGLQHRRHAEGRNCRCQYTVPCPQIPFPPDPTCTH